METPAIIVGLWLANRGAKGDEKAGFSQHVMHEVLLNGSVVLLMGAFLIGYGLFRFISEYFREPDSFLGLRAFDLSQGQWLSLPMIAIGVWMWLWAGRAQSVR